MNKILISFIFLISFNLYSESFFTKDNLDIESRMDFFNVPGVSIAVVESGETSWSEGFGTANTDSLFQAASISKSITALGVLKLVEDGLLDLDKNINNYLKTWQLEDTIHTRNRKITTRMLLTHMSGISESGLKGYDLEEELPTLDDLLNGKGHKVSPKPHYFPGLKRRYSWSGYTIIQKIIEDVSGLSFEEYLNNNVLKPIGMTDSHLKQPLPENLKDRAIEGHDLFGEPIEGGWRSYPELAAAGMWSTATDIATFTIEIHKILTTDYEGILSKKSIEQMLSYNDGGWGLGVSLKFDKKDLIFRHSGKNSGYTNYYISKAFKGESIVIMTNGDNAWKLIMEILHSIENYKSWGI
ncbi:MAG: beta-lactamase family protein [Spirochaetaceae bacterium]